MPDEIAKEKKKLIEKGLEEAKKLVKQAKKEPFPDEESLLEEQHRLAKMEKDLGEVLEPRKIKKPDHHMDEAEKIELKKIKKK